MDSLLAAYASDEDDDNEVPAPAPTPVSSLFRSLPEPKKCRPALPESEERPAPVSSLFRSLPAPKKRREEPLVQFRPPVDVSSLSEDVEEPKKAKRPRHNVNDAAAAGPATILGGLVLPAPKHGNGAVLGAGSGGSGGSGRCLDISSEQEVQDTEYYSDPVPLNNQDAGFTQDATNYAYYSSAEYTDNSQYQAVGETSFVDSCQTVEEDPVAKADRRRDRGGPVTFVSIKQDDLTANRPREDQMRLTGIAFGSMFKDTDGTIGENKPSKLHKRKHQIGSLLYDLKQKEVELAERRAQGFLNKAQTHAKYGW